MKKPTKKFKKFLESKKTTAIALVVLLLPFVIFGFIILRDSSQTGEPVVGNRYENQLEPAITTDQISGIEAQLTDENIIYKKVSLKASTLRVYLEVDVAISKEEIKEMANSAYATVIETLPIETYFTLTDRKKMYDFEIHVYNNAEDRESEEFVYYEIIKASSIEESRSEFITDARDPEYRDEVLENLAEKEKIAAEEKAAEEQAAAEELENEDDKGGE